MKAYIRLVNVPHLHLLNGEYKIPGGSNLGVYSSSNARLDSASGLYIWHTYCNGPTGM
ncbi:MAG TPA: hypothetical protein VFI14_05010 [Chryseosolibacter sp.]|nr:hypothetical protein [Chryseosolibacter sp.]